MRYNPATDQARLYEDLAYVYFPPTPIEEVEPSADDQAWLSQTLETENEEPWDIGFGRY